jgi:alkylation response protein AidB-like acyl-CoA dehydrogenase
MDLSFTETQNLIKNSAREFLTRECPRSFIKEMDESDSGFSPDLWRQMSEMGWVGMALPGEYGGGDASFTDVAVLFEELGYACVSSPLHSSVILGGALILAAGSDAQKRDLLPSIANGSRILAVAITEPEYGWGSGFINLQASASGGGFTLNGTKLFVPDVQIADQILVVARTSPGTDNGLTMFLVDKGTAGLSSRVLTGWTGDKQNEVVFSNVQVPASAVVGPVDGAWAPLDGVLDRATAVLNTYMVGGMQRLMEISTEYSQNRIHFGVPIGSFQRVQDYIIDILNHTEASRWTAYEALWKLDEGHGDAPMAVSMAKAVASHGYPASAQDAHHVHAGTGADMAYGMYLYTKKSKNLHSYLGDASFHKHRVAQALEL